MGSHGRTKGSLAWLNYPAQIIFISTKVTEIKVRPRQKRSISKLWMMYKFKIWEYSKLFLSNDFSVSV
ncbi:unnamed protein product [Amaranthus hypochondriacus]